MIGALHGARRAADPRSWQRAFQRMTDRGEQLADEFVGASIDDWVDEGHLGSEAADELRRRLATPEVSLVLRNFGVHLAIPIPLRFPFGALTRFAWTAGSRIRAEWRALRRLGSARLARQVHSLLVMTAALAPGFGSGAYLLAKPLRSNRALAVVMLDRMLRRAPLRVYRRLHLVALTTWWARPKPRRPTVPWRSRIGPELRERAALLPPHPRAIVAVFGLNAAVLGVGGFIENRYASSFAFSENLGLVNSVDAAQLLAAGLLGLLAFHWFWSEREAAAAPAEAAGWGFLLVGAIGVLVAWRWVGLGGAVLTTSGIALGVAATVSFTPREALGIALLYGVPGVLLLAAWAATRPPWQAASVAAAVLAGFVGGGVQANRLYDHYYGAAHPSSSIAVEDSAVIEWVWSGAVTPSSVIVKARLARDSPAVRLVVEEAAAAAARHYSTYAAAAIGANDRVVSLAVSGLEAGTSYRYWLEVDGRIDTTRAGEFTTFADGPFLFTLAIGSDARLGSNGAVFDAIREARPDLYLIAGELFYANIADADPEAFRDAYNDSLSQPSQGALYRGTPVVYVWDDHDFGANNSDSGSASREAAQFVYRELVPHYPLVGGAGAQPIYHAFSVGRVRFLVTDSRSERTSETILGEAQREWLKRELLAARDSHALTVWVNSVPWIVEEAAGADHWGGYPEARRELADYIARHGIDNLVMLAGDAHMLAFDDGSNSDYSSTGGAGFPVIHAGALDRPGSTKGGPFSEGMIPGTGQFVLMTILDDGGPELSVRWSGRDWTGRELMSLEFSTTAPSAAPR